MFKNNKNRVIPQMFDIRHTQKAGDLDWEKIKQAENNQILKIKRKIFIDRNKTTPVKLAREIKSENPVFEKEMRWQTSYAPLREKESFSEKEYLVWKKPQPVRGKILSFGEAAESDKQPVVYEVEGGKFYFEDEIEVNPEIIFHEPIETPIKKTLPKKKVGKKYIRKSLAGIIKFFKNSWEFIGNKLSQVQFKKIGKLKPGINFTDIFSSTHFQFSYDFRKTALSFSGLLISILLLFLAVSFVSRGLGIKGKVLGKSSEGLSSVETAIADIKKQDFGSGVNNFSSAENSFQEASQEIDKFGNILVETSKYIPIASQLGSAKYAMEAAENLANAGKNMSLVVSSLEKLRDGSGYSTLLEVYDDIKNPLVEAGSNLNQAVADIEKVNIDDIPEAQRDEFVFIKNELPSINKELSQFYGNIYIFRDILGANGPRKYLFLFQNNQEMRPTGGFIGTYGLLDIKDGRIRNFYIDGIFNPDGQLKDKIVPPKPIQKISAAWSLHDSNWWPDFPKSAQKAILFFEKTGGPTVDGVITLTPQVMIDMLKVTGPIEMEEYGVEINSENFIEIIQQETEENYDKELNQPKKIISDLAPILIDRLLNSDDVGKLAKSLGVILKGLEEKHILIYSENSDLQETIENIGWSGKILETSGDYLSVVNTNINGFKTDGIVKEKITHMTEILKDGTIEDKVTITREHLGGDTPYPWWNGVNADYMRVYVPEGSKLLEASGQTREFTDPPLDYEKLGFRIDQDVAAEEDSMKIDYESGTRTYVENGKTVFANWIYVSPKESVTLTYKYILPFKADIQNAQNPAISYSLLAQKQSGSVGSNIEAEVIYPRDYGIIWQNSDPAYASDSKIVWQKELNIDRYFGIVAVQK